MTLLDDRIKTPEDLARLSAEDLAALWLEAKEGENAFINYRREVEECLTRLLPMQEEGSKTTAVGNYKITMTGVINRKLDLEAWDKLRESVPVDFWPTKLVEEVDNTGCKYLKKNQPEIWAICAKAITEKPGKTGVKVVANGD